MRVGIAMDHGGFSPKVELAMRLRDAGFEVVDFGASTKDPKDDYPDFVIPLAEAIAAGKVDRGVAICGSGARVAVEQASTFGWEPYIGASGRIIAMETFGASAPLKALQTRFGFEPDRVILVAKELLGQG